MCQPSVLNHSKYIMGPEKNLLEQRLAKFTGICYAITCSSGTNAFFMALMAYRIVQIVILDKLLTFDAGFYQKFMLNYKLLVFK